jgi:antitoxin YefM
MESISIDEAAKNLSELAAKAKEEGCHFLITSDEGNTVLLSEETYQSIVVTLELLTTPGLLNGLNIEKDPPTDCSISP